MANDPVDLGNGYSYTKLQWKPERDINPQYAGVPDVPWCGILISCPHHNSGHVQFNIPGHAVFKDKGWDVESWEPLTIKPSIQFMEYKDGKHVPGCCHGFIRGGRWVSA